jgi:hypothetical protein
MLAEIGSDCFGDDRSLNQRHQPAAVALEPSGQIQPHGSHRAERRVQFS